MVGTLDRMNGRRGGVILVFHETTPEILQRQLDQIAQRYTFISLDAFVDRLIAGKSTTGVCAITFDDGIGSVTETASALAITRGWPMTFYLPTRYLDTGEAYWFFELGLLLKRAAGANVVFEEDGAEPGQPRRDRSGVEDSARVFHSTSEATTLSLTHCANCEAPCWASKRVLKDWTCRLPFHGNAFDNWLSVTSSHLRRIRSATWPDASPTII